MYAWKENGDRYQYEKLVEQYEKDKKTYDKKYPHPESKNGFVVKGIWEITETPFEPSRVSYNEVGISLHVYGLYNTYDIAWRDIKMTFKDIGDWIATLTEKTWCDTILIHDFIECVWNHYGKEEPQFLD